MKKSLALLLVTASILASCGSDKPVPEQVSNGTTPSIKANEVKDTGPASKPNQPTQVQNRPDAKTIAAWGEFSQTGSLSACEKMSPGIDKMSCERSVYMNEANKQKDPAPCQKIDKNIPSYDAEVAMCVNSVVTLTGKAAKPEWCDLIKEKQMNESCKQQLKMFASAKK